ncbi:amino acid adenylation domain-containing protein [Candidatus Uabimicrobium amorphum]
MGWFTSVFPVYLEIDPQAANYESQAINWREIICSVKEQLRSIPDKGVGFGVLQYLHLDPDIRQQLSQTKSQISFNYLGQFSKKSSSLWNIAAETTGESIGGDNHRRYLLDILGVVRDQQLRINFVYSPVLNEQNIQQLVQLYKQSLEQMIDHCQQPNVGSFTPSDFPWLNCSQKQLDQIVEKNYSNIETVYPSTTTQQGLLFHALYAPKSDQYCVQLELEYTGRLSKEELHHAWQAVVDKYATLRTKFAWEDGRFWQIVHKQVKIEWCELDWREHTEEKQQQLLQEYMQQDRGKGFDFEKPGLTRFCLIQMCDARHVLLWTHHHLLLDGWCVPILLEEVAKHCEGHSLGREGNTHRHYFTWLQQQNKNAALDFWKQQMAQVEAVTPLHIQKTGTILDVYQADAQVQGYQHQISQEVTQKMQRFSKECRITLNTLVQFAWAKVLSCYSGQDSVVYGTVTSGRSHPVAGLDKHISLLINTVPVHAHFKEEQTIDMLNKFQQTIQQISDYDYVGLSEIQAQSQVPTGTPLFYSLFVYQNYPTNHKESQEELQLTQFKGHEKTNYPLTLLAVPGRTFQLKAMYNSNCFSLESIKRLLHHLEQTILNVLESPQQPVQKINIVGNLEKKELLRKWNQTQVCYNPKQVLSQYLESQVEKTPANIALQFAEETLSYQEFNAQVNQMAHAIRKRYMDCYGQNMPAGALIGICTRRNLQMVVAIWGILKAGAAYVPLEPDYPQQRLDYMIEDSQVDLLLTQKDILQIHTLSIDEEKTILLEDDFSTYSSQNPTQINNREDLVYMIYTSGSTGKPKGVMLEHRGVINLILWMQETCKLQSQESLLHKTPFSFDASVWELLWPFFVGARLVIANAEGHKDPQYLYDTIKKYQITTIHFVPSMFQAFLETTQFEDLTSLQRIFCGGEALPSRLSEEFLTRHKTCTLFNSYGPTETSIAVSHWTCDVKDHLIHNTTPIGKPIGNIRLYVLDRSLCPVPIGVPGELYISGVGLARGYKNRPQLNQEKFIANPFVSEEDQTQKQYLHMYRTGDLVKRMPDGNIDFLGRIDFQIKLRGFRIELGEIETVLANHPSISQCAVVLQNNLRKQLVGYCVNKSSERIDESDLRAYLQNELPEYMIPSIFVYLDSLPLNANGKLDRSRLPQNVMAPKNDYIAPASELEKTLAVIWQQVLNMDRIGVDDNFFRLGGDSILSLQLIYKAREAGWKISPKELFENPNIRSLAMVTKKLVATTISERPVYGEVPLTPIQHQFFEQNLAQRHHWNMAFLLEWNQPLNIELLQKALNCVLKHHDSFRLRFTQTAANKWRQFYQEEIAMVEIVTHKLSSKTSEELREEINQVSVYWQQQFNIEQGPIFKAVLFDGHNDGKERLLIVVHHLVMDGVSRRILLEDLHRAYQQLEAGQKVKLPRKSSSFQEWADTLVQYAENLSSQISYWLAIKQKTVPRFPDGNAQQHLQENRCSTSFTLSVDLTKALLQDAHVYHTQINELLLSALCVTFYHWRKQSLLLLDLAGHGREESVLQDDRPIDLTRTIGWFTSFFPICLEIPDEEPQWSEIICSIKEQLRTVPSKGLGFGILRYLHPQQDVRTQLAQNPAQIRFNYIGQFSTSGKDALWKATTATSNNLGAKNHRRYLLDIVGVVRDAQLSIIFSHSAALEEQQVSNLAELYQKALEQMISHCQQTEI